MTWTVEQTSPTVTTIRIPVNRNREWEQWALITSDRHIDSPKSDRSMQRRHLEQARAPFNRWLHGERKAGEERFYVPEYRNNLFCCFHHCSPVFLN